MDIPPPRNGYLDVAADIGSYASYSITRNIRQHPLADQSVELIKRWLKECTQNHIECVVTEESKLPARVVDIGLDLDPKQPRLLVTNGQTGQYLAFSHCWGSKPLFRTLRSNIEQLQTRIPVQKLPRSFIDAIEVARILRIRYIWIDSLCIIQDDADDWEREAQKMGLIYENSQCTIAATSSDSSSSGQMYPQDYSGSPFLPLPYDGKDPARGSFYITQSRQKTDPLLNVSQAPLNTRGWVLQERLLSRRILHFAADQVYWECRSHALAQDGTVFRPKGPVDFLFPLPSLIRSIHNSFSNHRGSDEIFMRSWLHIIEFYSACNFTYEKDRLPALLGLADRLSRFTNREYINGHWFDLSSNVIPNTLLWTACGQITKISKKQLAPSWSWAAAEGEFSFESANVGIIPRILRLERSDTFGIPDFVTLHISCELCQAYPFLSLDEGQSRVNQIWKSKYRDRNWKPSTSVTEQGTLCPDLLGHITFDSITNIPEVIDCMHLYCDRAGYTRIMALIPAKANDEATNVYQRVGIGSFRRGPWPEFVKKEIQLV
ncbi:heterokaryon incompatibility protein-domain-containing protein [Hyaloscypha finlandica]|nr:heterokaryon incompatibility protein-domain-containing protein [Hyaloscypha finlandica]